MKNGVRILAVEDETAVAQLLALVLCGPKCNVTTAADGAEALLKIDQPGPPFDIVITDHSMPHVTGLELVQQLRARNFEGKIAVLSAHLTEKNVRAYEELHVDLMLSKPFDIDELRRAVDILAEPTPVLVGRGANLFSAHR
ncbi:MAG TPA: response regulator [Chthoniobacterales bacterium]|jgi:CheY-like chemotaxis protein